MEIREATAKDAQAIADIHVNSWRETYRAALTEDYLQNVVPNERSLLWMERLHSPKPNQRVFVAEEARKLVGFACAYIGDNPAWGTYLDNLHVTRPFQGKGIGKALVRMIAAHCHERAPGKGLCLLVNQDNVKAQNVYNRLGARNAQESVWHAPDGSSVPTYWFVWDDICGLLNPAE